MLDTGSFQDLMANGVLCIYSGTQPTDADAAETGTLLCKITKGSGAFTPGTATNGINFDNATGGALLKAAAEVWSGVNVATGTAGWFRLYANAMTTGADATGAALRCDGAISTSGAQINMSSTAMAIGATTTLDAMTVTLPAS
jgi:hypothetical protein